MESNRFGASMEPRNPTGKGGFKKGQSGNPNGRPKKGESLTDVLRSTTDGKSGKSKKSVRQAITERLVQLALDGDLAAIKYIFDRLDGRPIETKQITGADGEDLHVTYEIIN